MHDVSGAPWWAVIVGMAMTYRALSFTLLFGSARRQAKMVQMEEAARHMQTSLGDFPISGAEKMSMMQVIQKAQTKAHGTQFYKALLPVFSMVSVSIIFSFSCRNLLLHDKTFETEGILW